MGITEADIDALLTSTDALPSDDADDDASASPRASRRPNPHGASSGPAPSTSEPVTGGARELERLLHLEVPVLVKLAEREMTVESVLKFNVGSVLEFDRSAESELDLVVNNQVIGSGQAVKVGENFGLRITHIGTPSQRIAALGNN